jgi:hypothetical protein
MDVQTLGSWTANIEEWPGLRKALGLLIVGIISDTRLSRGKIAGLTLVEELEGDIGQLILW